MNPFRTSMLILLTTLVFPVFQARAYAVQHPDVRLAAAPAQRAIAVSNEAPLLSAPETTTIFEGVLTSIEATVMDADPEDSLAISVTGLPPGMKAVIGTAADGKKVASAFGIVNASRGPFTVTWLVTDGLHPPVSSETVVSVNASSQAVDERRVREFVHSRFFHGVPSGQSRRLGIQALPILSRLLRDEAEKPYWLNIIQTIGPIGDTAYFDTLRAFVWNRFQGDLDLLTFKALMLAQANLGTIANRSSRAVIYLSTHADPSAWSSLPWHYGAYQGARLGVQMTLSSIDALSYVNDPAVATMLLQLQAEPPAPEQVANISEGLRRNAAIRRIGLLEYQAQEESGSH